MFSPDGAWIRRGDRLRVSRALVRRKGDTLEKFVLALPAGRMSHYNTYGSFRD